MNELVRNKPAAKFFYRGNHSHPVRRTVLVTEQSNGYFKGFEIRCGNETFDVDTAPVKTYSVDKVATTSQLRSDSPLKNKKDVSTLERMSITQLEEVGI